MAEKKKARAMPGDVKMQQEKKEEFKEADVKLDAVMKQDREKALQGKKDGYDKSRVHMRDKTFMKISDVDTEDAAWFKGFCDKHTDRKQFLGMKVIRTIIENLDPIVKNVLTQINSLTARVDSIEACITQPPVEEEPKVILPATQGSAKKEAVKK